MAPDTTKEISALVRKSQRKLDSARKNLEAGFFDDAISRAYYACYHAAQAVLLTKELRARSHRGLKNLFGLHFVQAGIIDRKFALILDDLQNERENSDYEIFLEFTKQEAQEAIQKAEKFLAELKKLLPKN